MSSESEQQPLEGEPVNDDKGTYQERVINLYNSSSYLDIAIGFWGKLLIELIIVAVPMFLLTAVPAGILAYFGYFGLTYQAAIAGWVTLSTTVLGFTWCFTETDDEEDTESSEEEGAEEN